MARFDRLDVGASSAHRWMSCTASPRYILQNADKLPDESSDFADEGTQAHEVAACLLDGKGVQPGTPAEMLAHVQVYVDHVRSHQREGARLRVEKRVPLFYYPERNGIIDASTVTPDAIYVDDLKYGVGVSVQAEGNVQLAIYGESVVSQLEMVDIFPDHFPVHLSIVQPRDRHDPNPIRVWSLTRGELREFTRKVAGQAEIAISGVGAAFAPDEDTCRFCPAKGLCSAYGTHGLVALPDEVREQVLLLPDPAGLTREQRIRIIRAKDALEDWMDAVKVQETTDLLNGAPPAGYKLVAGRSNRGWSDPAAAQKLLSIHLRIDEMRPRADLISPAAAEKALKGVELSTRFKNRWEALITRPEGKPTLVPEDDPRPALNDSNLDKLEKLENP